jgi:hypothetical protein
MPAVIIHLLHVGFRPIAIFGRDAQAPSTPGLQTEPPVIAYPVWTPVKDRPDLDVALQLAESLFDRQRFL